MKVLSLLVLACLTMASCRDDRPDRVVGNRNLKDQETRALAGEQLRGSTDCDSEDQPNQSNATTETTPPTATTSEEPTTTNTEVSTEVPPHVPGTSSAEIYVYFRCNATGWELNDANLMANDGKAFQSEVNITADWMVQNGDACVFTVTDKKGAWTPNTQEFVSTALPALDSQVYEAVLSSKAGANTFRMKYSKLGKYVVSFSYENRLFTLLPL